MIPIWTSNLQDPEEIKKFQDAIKNSMVLDRLHDLLIAKRDSLEGSELSLDSYDKPNWDYRQAHKNGYLSCLKQIMMLTSPDQRKK